MQAHCGSRLRAAVLFSSDPTREWRDCSQSTAVVYDFPSQRRGRPASKKGEATKA